MQNKLGVRSEGWLPDILRASIATILYVAGIWVGLSNSFLYGGGLAGYFPFLLALFVGPWATAWAASKIMPRNRPLLMRLALGTYAGFIPFLAIGYTASVLTPDWKLGDPPPRLTQNEEAFLFVALFLLSQIATTTAFSRWNARTAA
jgi:hypothetical protein